MDLLKASTQLLRIQISLTTLDLLHATSLKKGMQNYTTFLLQLPPETPISHHKTTSFIPPKLRALEAKRRP